MSTWPLLPGDSDGAALAISAAGDIVGISASSHHLHAVRFAPGRAIDLSPGHESAAWAVNDRGQTVGEATLTPAGGFHAVLFAAGKVSDLDPRDTRSQAYGINDAGTAVGTALVVGVGLRAVTFDRGRITNLGTLPGDTASFIDRGTGAFDAAGSPINARGDVVGVSSGGARGARAVLFTRGRVLNLGQLVPNRTARALNIGDDGLIVGEAATTSGETHAVAFVGGAVVDLNDRIAPNAGWLLESARATNRAGQIVGFGIHAGATHAYRLDPHHLTSSRWSIGLRTALAIVIVLVLIIVTRSRKRRRANRTVPT